MGQTKPIKASSLMLDTAWNSDIVGLREFYDSQFKCIHTQSKGFSVVIFDLEKVLCENP